MKEFLNLDSSIGRITFYFFQLVASVISVLLFMRMLVRSFMSLGGADEWLLPLWLIADLIATVWWAHGSRRSAVHVAAGLFVQIIGCTLWIYLFF